MPAPGLDSTAAGRRCAGRVSRMMPRPTCSESVARPRVEAAAVVAPRSTSPGGAARAARRGWRRHACASLDSASCTMCSTWICTSGAGRPSARHVQRGAQAGLVLELGQVARRAARCPRPGAGAKVHQQLAHVGVTLALARPRPARPCCGRGRRCCPWPMASRSSWSGSSGRPATEPNGDRAARAPAQAALLNHGGLALQRRGAQPSIELARCRAMVDNGSRMSATDPASCGRDSVTSPSGRWCGYGDADDGRSPPRGVQLQPSGRRDPGSRACACACASRARRCSGNAPARPGTAAGRRRPTAVTLVGLVRPAQPSRTLAAGTPPDLLHEALGQHLQVVGLDRQRAHRVQRGRALVLHRDAGGLLAHLALRVPRASPASAWAIRLKPAASWPNSLDCTSRRDAQVIKGARASTLLQLRHGLSTSR